MDENEENFLRPSIRQASVDDVETVYSLLRSAFGQTSLNYTIYRSPLAIQYLYQLITNPNQKLFIIHKYDLVFGFYHALVRETELFLNYIVVDYKYRGNGFGVALIRHYENLAKSLGFKQVVLEALGGNTQVLDWYQHLEYRIVKKSYSIRIPLVEWDAKTNISFSVDPVDWERAVCEEAKQGFSKLQCMVEQEGVTLGLISGSCLKLLYCPEYLIESFISAVANRFFPYRNELILTSLDFVQPYWPVISKDTVMLMSKQLR